MMMGLILKRRHLNALPFWTTIEGGTSIGFEVEKRVLSQPYEMPDGTLLEGEILKVDWIYGVLTSEEIKILNELKMKKISLFLSKPLLGTKDHLLLSDSSWRMIRDYGILPSSGYVFDIKIFSALIDGEQVKIYPKRDVVVE